jgi:membrane glycosyltransferase
VAVWAGRPGPGLALRRVGLLLTPEEVAPAAALRRAWAQAALPAPEAYFKPVQLA